MTRTPWALPLLLACSTKADPAPSVDAAPTDTGFTAADADTDADGDTDADADADADGDTGADADVDSMGATADTGRIGGALVAWVETGSGTLRVDLSTGVTTPFGREATIALDGDGAFWQPDLTYPPQVAAGDGVAYDAVNQPEFLLDQAYVFAAGTIGTRVAVDGSGSEPYPLPVGMVPGDPVPLDGAGRVGLVVGDAVQILELSTNPYVTLATADLGGEGVVDMARAADGTIVVADGDGEQLVLFDPALRGSALPWSQLDLGAVDRVLVALPGAGHRPGTVRFVAEGADRVVGTLGADGTVTIDTLPADHGFEARTAHASFDGRHLVGVSSGVPGLVVVDLAAGRARTVEVAEVDAGAEVRWVGPR